jgi:hypothetical protein
MNVKSWKGMLVAQPARTTVPDEYKSLGLTGFRECRVLVEWWPDSLKDGLTHEDIENFIADKLEKIGIRVVSYDDQRKTYQSADKSTDERILAAQDRLHSTVCARVDAFSMPLETICGYVELECRRGAFIHPGYFSTVTVWKRVRPSHPADKVLKGWSIGALDILLVELEKDWKQCNR